LAGHVTREMGGEIETIRGFGGKTWRKETTWNTQTEMRGQYQIGS